MCQDDGPVNTSIINYYIPPIYPKSRRDQLETLNHTLPLLKKITQGYNIRSFSSYDLRLLWLLYFESSICLDNAWPHLICKYPIYGSLKSLGHKKLLGVLLVIKNTIFHSGFLAWNKKKNTSYSSFIQSISKPSAVAKSCISFSVKNRIPFSISTPLPNDLSVRVNYKQYYKEKVYCHSLNQNNYSTVVEDVFGNHGYLLGIYRSLKTWCNLSYMAVCHQHQANMDYQEDMMEDNRDVDIQHIQLFL